MSPDITLSKLCIENSTQLYSLLQEIEGTLSHREYWLPIDNVSYKHFFDDTWTIFYGAFCDNNLIGASALFLNKHEFAESLRHADIPVTISEVAEIGRTMVKPSYRGMNIALAINRQLVQEAKKQDKKFVLATIHPDNIPSQHSFKRLGLYKVARYEKLFHYPRDVLMGGT